MNYLFWLVLRTFFQNSIGDITKMPTSSSSSPHHHHQHHHCYCLQFVVQFPHTDLWVHGITILTPLWHLFHWQFKPSPLKCHTAFTMHHTWYLNQTHYSIYAFWHKYDAWITQRILIIWGFRKRACRDAKFATIRNSLCQLIPKMAKNITWI